MIRKALKSIAADRSAQRRAEFYRNLIRHEGKIGGALFGPIPKGTRREFFCLDRHTWVWHEESQDKHGQSKIKIVRYSIRPDVILKTFDGSSYQAVSPKEALNLYQAAKAYQQKVKKELYAFAV